MLSRLTASRFGAINRNLHAKRHTAAELCDGVEELVFADGNRVLQIDNFQKGQSKCFTTNGFIMAFGEGLQFEGVATETGESLGPTNNAWGGTEGTFKITGTAETTSVTFYHTEYGFEPRETESIDTLFMKKNFKGNITSTLTINIAAQQTIRKAVRFIHVNPLKSTVSFNTDAYLLIEGDGDDFPSISKLHQGNLQVTGRFIVATVVPKIYGDLVTGASQAIPSDGTYGDMATFTINDATTPENYPDQLIEFKLGAIFSTESPAYDPPNLMAGITTNDDDGDKLTAGEIAGIVIACVVVVAVVVFLIVWFAVLKKGCGNKKKTSSKSSSSS